jgi:hypothetical protein
MKPLENETFLVAYLISNFLAILILLFAIKWKTICRILFFIVFAWASWANWNMVLTNPTDYLDYADLAFLDIYKSFILGWFNEHIEISVGFIATAQGLIAISLLLKDWLYKIGLLAGITFLLAIIPLGIGSAFPCTMILAIALVLLRNENHYLWQRRNEKFRMSIE